MLEAPTQAWSDDIGRMGTAPIHGIYHGDVRHIRSIEITVDGTALESIGCVSAVPQQTVLTDCCAGSTTNRPTRRCGWTAIAGSPPVRSRSGITITPTSTHRSPQR